MRAICTKGRASDLAGLPPQGKCRRIGDPPHPLQAAGPVVRQPKGRQGSLKAAIPAHCGQTVATPAARD